MAWLVLGATGLLGPCFVDDLKRRGHDVATAARSGADVALDLSDLDALEAALADLAPEGVVNCAANIFVDQCEADPGMAYRVNTRPLSVLGEWSRRTSRPLLQVSTDHYFVTGGRKAQDELQPVDLVNEYARTKWLAESLALTAPRALVLRTNIVGAKKGHGRFVARSLRERAPMTLFMDFFASPIHVRDMARASLDLHAKGASGVWNVASRDVSSKGEFIYAVADALGVRADWVVEGSGLQLATKRAMCLGLDVSKAEALLGYALPTLEDSARALAEEPL